MLRLNGLTEYWKGLSGRIWNVEDDGITCDILIKKMESRGWYDMSMSWARWHSR